LEEGFDAPSGEEYLTGIDVLYWINLDRSIERKTKMENILKDGVFASIPKKERKVAIDGKKDDIGAVIQSNFAKNQLPEKTLIEHACLLSHLNTIRDFAENYKDKDDAIAMIMEDDMTLDYQPYWKETVRQIMQNAPQDWEIIMLTYTDAPMTEIYTKKVTGGAGAYLIKASAARKFIERRVTENKYNLNMDLLFVSDLYIYNEFLSYVYKFPYFIYPLENDSEIHPDHLSFHAGFRKRISKELYGIDE
jgi:GR25 family glycosyltransferase involved in LPS biosynthesis